MSIVLENSLGCLLCHESFLDDVYRHVPLPNPTYLKVKAAFFDIKTPILMDSAATKLSKNSSYVKKRKSNKQAVEVEAYHDQVKSAIEGAVDALVIAGKSVGHFRDDEILPLDWLQNNASARQAAKEVLSGESISLTSTIYGENKEDFAAVKIIDGLEFVLPPKSVFIQSDIKDLSLLYGNKYDVIVLDPPWQNKSVRRQKKYCRMYCEELLNLPIQYLMEPGCIVVVWCTNNERQLGFIKKKLFPKWRVKHCVDWHWVKVTKRGALVHPLNSHQKKPYENLVLGHALLEDDQEGNKVLPSFPDHKVIVSVPSSIHSHKPPLSAILKQYLPENAKCLELFARYLLPGWTSFGNEVLKLQTLKMFDLESFEAQQ